MLDQPHQPFSKSHLVPSKTLSERGYKERDKSWVESIQSLILRHSLFTAVLILVLPVRAVLTDVAHLVTRQASSVVASEGSFHGLAGSVGRNLCETGVEPQVVNSYVGGDLLPFGELQLEPERLTDPAYHLRQSPPPVRRRVQGA